LTIWQKSSVQTFGIEIESNQGIYQYELSIEHQNSWQQARIIHEKLLFNGHPLLIFNLGEALLYRDDQSVGPIYPFDSNQSAVATVPARKDNTRLTWFT